MSASHPLLDKLPARKPSGDERDFLTTGELTANHWPGTIGTVLRSYYYGGTDNRAEAWTATAAFFAQPAVPPDHPIARGEGWDPDHIRASVRATGTKRAGGEAGR